MATRASTIVRYTLTIAGIAIAGTAVAHVESGRTDSLRPGYASPRTQSLSAVARLGAKLFFDASLSASGRMSCATCHNPAAAYAPHNARAVQLGGEHLASPGLRTVPSLGYMTMTLPFTIGPEGPFESEIQSGPSSLASPSADNVAAVSNGQPKTGGMSAPTEPRGGFFWDGRADTLQEQIAGPLLSPFEMANPSPDAVSEKLAHAPYAGQFSRLFGARILADKAFLFSEAAFAIARYEFENPAFHSFTSKYDYYLRGEAMLSAAEARGLRLFDDPQKGNCAACHPDRIAVDGRLPEFTDYEYEALGAPRNHAIPANANPRFFDLGICGPMRDDAYARQPSNCGLFKTPTLRNVATRRVFFHNGIFRTLSQVLHFYVERDTDPGKFYPHSRDGSVEKFDDLPPQYRGNVDVVDAPLDRKSGDAPALDDAEIQDVIAFLKTLTDGYARP